MQSTFSDPHATEFFSFTLYDTDGYLMDGNTIISSRDMTANDDGTYTVSINCGGDGIHNISAPAEMDVVIDADTPEAVAFMESEWDPCLRYLKGVPPSLRRTLS